MAKPPSYFRTLGDAFATLKKYPQLFIPVVLSFLVSLILTPFTNRFSAEFTQDGLPSNFGVLILFLVVICIVLFIIYGWQFTILKQIFKTKKVTIRASFKSAFPMTWKIFKIGLFMTVISFLFFLALTIVTLIGVGIGTGIFKLNAVAGMVISIILALIGFDFLLALMVLFFLAFCYLFYIMPVITLEDKGAWATIVYAYHKFRKNMGFWAKNGILTFLVIILAEIPYFIYLFSISGFIAPPTSLSQILISQLTTFPVVILGLAVQIAYCFFYKGQK